MRLTSTQLQIIKRLKQLYPEVTCPLRHTNAFELLVATMLSAQSTDVRVNLTTPELFRQFPNAEAFAKADIDDLKQIIRPIGLANTKAKNIKATSTHLLKYHAGEVPSDLNALLRLPGVGRKIATVVLGNWFGINAGFTVDTHVKRVAQRLKLTKHTDPVKIEQDLMQIFPRAEWADMSLRLVFYGREYCKARGPQCELCKLVESK